MSKINTALILFPNQLFAPELLPKTDVIYLIEDPLFFGLDNEFPRNYHKQKLLLHKASMRRYTEETLWQVDLDVEYVEMRDISSTLDILSKVHKSGAELVMLFDPVDNIIESRLKKSLDDMAATPFELKVLPTPSFMLKKAEVKDFFSGTKTDFMNFYKWQRERFNILISDYKPVGGKWIVEGKNKTDALASSPGFDAFGGNQYVEDAKQWVEQQYKNNIGNLNNFFWPTTHSEAKLWLNDFCRNRLPDYASQRGLIDKEAVLHFSSALSPLLNIGLLTPKQVVDEVIKISAKSDFDLANIELLIRQIIGHREYVRGLYATKDFSKPKTSGQNKLDNHWYTANTLIEPVDITINKAIDRGYLTDVELSGVMANFMVLCEIATGEIYKWMQSMLIDAFDWSLLPNLYAAVNQEDLTGSGVAQISSSDYLLGISNYQKGEWCDTWDGLYWAYVERHKSGLLKNPTTSEQIKQMPKITQEHRRIIGYRAQDFLVSINCS
jgi:deoxyribodipyrimidine photolyase-related protein